MYSPTCIFPTYFGRCILSDQFLFFSICICWFVLVRTVFSVWDFPICILPFCIVRFVWIVFPNCISRSVFSELHFPVCVISMYISRFVFFEFYLYNVYLPIVQYFANCVFCTDTYKHIIDKVLHFGRFHEETRDIVKGFPTCIFRFVFCWYLLFDLYRLVCIFWFVSFGFYLPICISRCASSDWYSFDLSFPNCNFDLYIPNSIFQIIFPDLCSSTCFFRFVFPRFLFSVVSEYHIFDCYFSYLYFPIYIYRFVFSDVFYFPICNSPNCNSVYSFLIYVLRIVGFLFYFTICISLLIFIPFKNYNSRFIFSKLYLPMCIFWLVPSEL